jgi:hypothetical protein
VNHTEQQLVLHILGENPTEGQIHHAASALVQHRAEKEVRAVVSWMEMNREHAARTLDAQWYPFVAPIPRDAKPVQVFEGPNIVAVKEPKRQPYKVFLRDLDAFCKEKSLDKGKMIDLGEGRIESYKGWTRTAMAQLGQHGEAGYPYVAPQPVNRKKVPTEKKPLVSVYDFAAEPITYSPPEK